MLRVSLPRKKENGMTDYQNIFFILEPALQIENFNFLTLEEWVHFVGISGEIKWLSALLMISAQSWTAYCL